MTSNPLKYHHFWTHCPCLRKGIFLHRSIRDWQKMQLFPSQFLSLVSGSAQRKNAHVENKRLTISTKRTSPFSEHLVKYQMAFFCVCMCVGSFKYNVTKKTFFQHLSCHLSLFCFTNCRLSCSIWDINLLMETKWVKLKYRVPVLYYNPSYKNVGM